MATSGMWRPNETLRMPVTFSRLRNCITLKMVPSRTDVMWKFIPTSGPTRLCAHRRLFQLYPAPLTVLYNSTGRGEAWPHPCVERTSNFHIGVRTGAIKGNGSFLEGQADFRTVVEGNGALGKYLIVFMPLTCHHNHIAI